MKKIIIFSIALSFVIGCSPHKEESRVVSVQENRDYINEGVHYLTESDLPLAIASFDQAIRQDPTNPKGYLILAETYMRLKEYGRAIDSLNAATRILPGNGDIYYLLALSHRLAGNTDAAANAASKSIELYRRINDKEKLMKSASLFKSLMQK